MYMLGYIFDQTKTLSYLCEYLRVLTADSAQMPSDVPNYLSPTFSTSGEDESFFTTPTACRLSATLLTAPVIKAEPVAPSVQSLPVTTGFSAFTRVIKEPICSQSQPVKTSSSESPHKASFALSY